MRPLPPSLAADEATSYAYRDGAFEPVPWRSQRGNPGPAGTVSGPAAEMAGLMIALLQGGSYQDHPILQNDNVRLLLQQNFTHHPDGFAIEANDDGTLSLSYPGLGEVARYVPVEPLVFHRVSGGPLSLLGTKIDLGELLVFREDESGRIPYAFVPFFSLALEKLAWYERTEVQVVLLAVMLTVFLSVVVSWPLGWLVRRWRKRSADSRHGRRRHPGLEERLRVGPEPSPLLARHFGRSSLRRLDRLLEPAGLPVLTRRGKEEKR